LQRQPLPFLGEIDAHVVRKRNRSAEAKSAQPEKIESDIDETRTLTLRSRSMLYFCATEVMREIVLPESKP
jgi:hypothetical protein